MPYANAARPVVLNNWQTDIAHSAAGLIERGDPIAAHNVAGLVECGDPVAALSSTGQLVGVQLG